MNFELTEPTSYFRGVTLQDLCDAYADLLDAAERETEQRALERLEEDIEMLKHEIDAMEEL